ncbi:hypothetical protein [Olivibacter sp. XZL3]|uniref:hypothetical protein n=1 Tax=Olivibacter sp. XZL3 TaxID=1735116 RepID=UPI001066FE4A|nr:hypothetical protein [Olivibacter sp. XZL3]
MRQYIQLFHQTSNSHSLIHQLQLSDHKMTSTSGKKIKGNIIKSFYGLASILAQVDPNPVFVPGKLIPRNEIVSFEYWWNQEIILTDSNGHDFTRRDIVLYVANKDGGGHVDSEVKNEFYTIKSGQTSGIVFVKGGITYTFSPLIATIRQIAQEVILSFPDEYLKEK